jgi:hypothetical protein
MLGEKIAESAGKVMVSRVLPSGGAGPQMETTFEANTSLLGVDSKETGTYSAVLKPEGYLFGGGQGVLMGAGGEMATWVGHGVGRIGRDGVVSYRGAIYYQSSSQRWSRLNGVAAVFEFEVEPQGPVRAQIWEWK